MALKRNVLLANKAKTKKIESLEKFVKYGSFALAALSLVLKVVKDRES